MRITKMLTLLTVPRLWERYFRHHPSLAELARITQTWDGHPGDPINIALVGSDVEVVRGMTAAGWFPADPITLASSVRIAADTVLHRPDDDAPVSNLFLFGRKQDLAFEQPVRRAGPRTVCPTARSAHGAADADRRMLFPGWIAPPSASDSETRSQSTLRRVSPYVGSAFNGDPGVR